MIKLKPVTLTFLLAYFLFSCSKDIDRPGNNNSNDLGPFTATVTQRLATTASIQWTAAVNNNNSDTVKYKVFLNNNLVDSNLTLRQYSFSSLNAGSYSGRIYAYTASGDTASAAFTINAFTGSTALGPFSVTVTQRLSNSASIQWTPSVNSNNADTVKYKIFLSNNRVDSNLTATQYVLSSLNSNSYNGMVYAYTASGDTASAAFTIAAFTAPPAPYSFTEGFYRVTEYTTLLSGADPRNYVFAAQVIRINDSTLQFVQSRRVPRTWWIADFPTQIYPALNDSLIGGGITPRGRILDSNTIRMSYLFGSSVVYNVRQLWQKLASPSDTSTIVYTYPNVPNMIKTVAGNNTSGVGSGSSGDGGLAINASLVTPNDVVADNSGNIYMTDGATGYSIRKVNVNGIISRFAGNNTSGFSGDGGQATAAQINYPQGLAIDPSGNLLISDAGNRVIRRVGTNGIINTIAGIPGSYGYSGDGGPATAAQLGSPAGMCVDAAGNIYFADPGRNVVRKIDFNGIISTMAGIAGSPSSGTFLGDGGPATAARLNWPNDVCIDPAGNLYIADKNNHAIRKVSTSGIISTIAGIGGFLNYGFTGDGGPATSAKLNNPQSISIDAAGNLYVSDYSNDRIRKISTSGIITTVGGNGQASQLGDGPDFWGGDYSTATSAAINAPYGIFWINNKLYIASSYRIRRISF